MERQTTDMYRVPGNHYVHMATDEDVSASKFPPMARPGIGPWLTDPEKIAQYDQVVVWKLDRFCRKASDMRDMMTWADKYGKKLVFLQDNLVYDPNATGIGKAINDAMISLVAAFAEIEAVNISTRTKSLHSHLREKRSWKGGVAPFGYEIKQTPDRKILVKSGETYPIFMEIVNRLIGGDSRNAIAKDLNDRKILSPKDWARVRAGQQPKGTEWIGQSIKNMFDSDIPLGYMTRSETPDGRGKRLTARDEDGNPIQAWEPLIDKETLRLVREAIENSKLAKRPHVEWEVNPLKDVVKCFTCGGNLARHKNNRGKLYLVCPIGRSQQSGCDMNAYIPMDEAWDILTTHFADHHGNENVTEGKYVKASPDATRLDELLDRYAAVEELYIKAKVAPIRERHRNTLDGLESEMSKLQDQTTRSGKWVNTELKETNRERWNRSTDEERREMMIKAQIILRMKREPRTKNFTSSIENRTAVTSSQ